MLRKNIFQVSRFLAVFTVCTINCLGMTATKDTVYETGFPIWNKWTHQYEMVNDSVSLVNNSNDTLILKEFRFLTPSWVKDELGFNVYLGPLANPPYIKNGGLVSFSVRPNIPSIYYSPDTPKIYPKARVFLYNFKLKSCFACPLTKVGVTSVKLDTITARLIVTTNKSSDTLVFIGDTDTTSTTGLIKKKSIRNNKLLSNRDVIKKVNVSGKRIVIPFELPHTVWYPDSKRGEK